MELDKVDSIVRSVVMKFVERSEVGRKKYGTDLDRSDLSVFEWVQHAQEEHMDAILYLEKLKRELSVMYENNKELKENAKT
jgi:hypothetical protein